jgi:hypothetical protein
MVGIGVTVRGRPRIVLFKMVGQFGFELADGVVESGDDPTRVFVVAANAVATAGGAGWELRGPQHLVEFCGFGVEAALPAASFQR